MTTTQIRIVHPPRTCAACTGQPVQLYHFGFDDGHNVSIAHGCVHFIRGCYPDVPDEWLAERAVHPGADCHARKFAVNDTVRIADGDVGYGTVVGFIDQDSTDERARDVTADGPLYLVNEGNVFNDRYEAVFAESELKPLEDGGPLTGFPPF